MFIYTGIHWWQIKLSKGPSVVKVNMLSLSRTDRARVTGKPIPHLHPLES
jgi:hypothetical protein